MFFLLFVNWCFCIDFTREFTIYHRKRCDEFASLESWGNEACQTLPSVAYLKYVLVPYYICNPEFIFKTTVALIQNECFDEFINSIKNLFENLAYIKKFQQILLQSKLPDYDKNLIFSVLEF